MYIVQCTLDISAKLMFLLNNIFEKLELRFLIKSVVFQTDNESTLIIFYLFIDFETAYTTKLKKKSYGIYAKLFRCACNTLQGTQPQRPAKSLKVGMVYLFFKYFLVVSTYNANC